MHIASPQVACISQNATIGQRVGDIYQSVGVLRISANGNAIAEMELAPGEYHVTAYFCSKGNGGAVMGEGLGQGRYKSSYASFTIAAGEVLNVGSFTILAGAGVFVNQPGMPIGVGVRVTDWPIHDVDKFKLERPKLFSQMKTRLMTVTSNKPVAPAKEDCARAEALRRDGKIASLPSGCGGM
jgi:hypothetical protein